MRRWLARLGVMSAMLAGCAAPDRPAEQTAQAREAALPGPLAATLVGRIYPQTLGTVANFGSALALEGNTLAGGNELFDDLAPRRGAVFMFERKLDEFEQVDVLGLGARTGSSLGGYVALDGSRLATTELDGPTGHRVTVYERRNGRFELDGHLGPMGPAPAGFAAAIAVSRDSVVVGSSVWSHEVGSGSAHVFTRDSSGWSQRARLSPGTLTIPAFGQAVAIENDLVAVGFAATSPDPSVWLYGYSGGEWTERARFAASDGMGRDGFGQPLAISAGRLYVGAPAAITEAGTAGAVYEYETIDGQWYESKLTSDTPISDGEFGSALSADWPRLLVGAPNDTLAGAAYLFSAEDGEWAPPVRISGADRNNDDEFGRSVALSGGTAVIGAPGHDGTGTDRGAAYFYAIGAAPGSPCTTAADCAGWCVGGVCCDKRCDGACETCQAVIGATADGSCTSLPYYTEVAGCLPKLCGGIGSCPQDCRNAGCSRSHFCDQVSGECVPRGASGGACKIHGECLSDFCDEGICCDRVCDACLSCKSSLTGSADGTCAPVFAGTDPHFACDVDPGFPANCAADGKCDGLGQCRKFAPPTTACGPASCEGSTISGDLCNGLGGCGRGQASCAPHQCRDGFCGESCRDDRDCSDNAFCTAAGSCVPKRANSSPCTRDIECASRSCTDGVCCNSRCDGQCESCRGKDTVGTCTVVFGDPPPERAPCSSISTDDSCTSSKCDGAERRQCSRVVTECDAYGCEDGRCKRSCTLRTSSEDCAPDAVCKDGTCIPKAACDPSKCGAYACDPAGACVIPCTSSLECVGGHSCTSKGECVRRADSGDFGCACRVATPGTEPPAWWLLGFFALVRRGWRRNAGSARVGLRAR